MSSIFIHLSGFNKQKEMRESKRWLTARDEEQPDSLPECLESPRGSSFGSLETLGVAHPTTRRTKKHLSEEKSLRRRSGDQTWPTVTR